MAALKFDLNKRTFFVLSGCSNPLGKSLALELCQRFAKGSVALVLDEQAELLQKELQAQLPFQVLTGAPGQFNAESLLQAVQTMPAAAYERAIIVHNEGEAATHALLEPQIQQEWLEYVQRQLYEPVQLNQNFLQCTALAGIEKLVINVTSSMQLRPFIYSSLLCSCKRARDMYFRAMAAEECRAGVAVLNYSPGLMETHVPQCDLNGNLVTDSRLELPRVKPTEATLKLINVLQELTFVSGHDVDYYDDVHL